MPAYYLAVESEAAKAPLMFRYTILVILLFTAAACTPKSKDVRITNDGPAEVQTKARSEPIFYNGKTYQLDFVPDDSGNFKMSVAGMSKAQESDAKAVATSSLRYFACPDGQTGKLVGLPEYTDAKWSMTARCART
jgi:hypothetical protein